MLGARALSEAELENTLPADQEEKDSQVESLLVDRVARFLSSHTLQLKVPEESISEMKKSLDEGEFIAVMSRGLRSRPGVQTLPVTGFQKPLIILY